MVLVVVLTFTDHTQQYTTWLPIRYVVCWTGKERSEEHLQSSKENKKHDKRVNPPDWEMLRRSRRVLIFLKKPLTGGCSEGLGAFWFFIF